MKHLNGEMLLVLFLRHYTEFCFRLKLQLYKLNDY